MEFISEFIVFLLEIAFWYFIIGIVTMPLRRKLDQKREDLENVIEKLNEIVHIVNVEKHGDCYYWFDADNDEFLAQGSTTDETIAHLKSRFPKHIFFVQSKDQSYKISAPDWKFVPFKLNESNSNS